MTTTTPDTLPQRLRNAHKHPGMYKTSYGLYWDLSEEAADLIDHLTAERDAALKALRDVQRKLQSTSYHPHKDALFAIVDAALAAQKGDDSHD